MYSLLPSYADRCPCCEGRKCAVRLGVYLRSVLLVYGMLIVIKVPRFRCLGRGPKRPKAATFSVLPTKVLPRRRWSLRMYLQVMRWARESSRNALEQLTDLAIVVDDWAVHRVKALAKAVCERLQSHSVEGYEVEIESKQDDHISKALDVFQRGTGPPSSLVLAWQRRWGQLLLDIKLS